MFCEPRAGDTAWSSPSTSDGQRLWGSWSISAAEEMNHGAERMTHTASGAAGGNCCLVTPESGVSPPALPPAPDEVCTLSA